MNYPYVADPQRALKAVLDQNPAASLEQARNAHPMLKSLSPDHLSLQMARLIEARTFVRPA